MPFFVALRHGRGSRPVDRAFWVLSHAWSRWADTLVVVKPETVIGWHRRGFAIDFLTVPTATFGVLYVSFVLSLERRLVLHVNVTAHPYAAWAAQQMIEAVAPDVVAERVIRDRDGIFAAVFDKRLAGMGLEQFRIAPRAPWQNGFAAYRAQGHPCDAGRDLEALDELPGHRGLHLLHDHARRVLRAVERGHVDRPELAIARIDELELRETNGLERPLSR